MAFDTTRLLAQINQTGCLPTGRFTDQELLNIAYDAMLSQIVPEVIKIREEYYVKYSDSSITAAQIAYPVVSRALAGILREVKVVSGSSVKDLERVELDSITAVQTGTPDRFYLSGNDLMLWPTPASTADTLRQYYFIRPSKFVPVSETAIITAINTTNKTITVTIPTGWTTNSLLDLVKGTAHYDIIAFDLVITGATAGVITFSATLPTTLAVGDYVSLAGESCFPFLPQEGHIALAQVAAATALESIGDPNAAGAAAKATMLKENFKSLLSLRIQGAPKRLGTRVL